MSGEILIANKGAGLIKIEVLTRDENGRFQDIGVVHEICDGEFSTVAMPENAAIQINAKDD